MSVHGTVKSAYLGLADAAANSRLMEYKWLLEQEANTWSYWMDLPVRRRLWLLRHGFPSPFGKLYDLETHGPEPYLSELQRYRLYKALNGRHRYLIDDKLAQHWMLADYPDNRPTAFGFLDGGKLHGVAGTAYDGPPTPVAEWLPPALREHGTLVLKHLRGKGGKEVVVVAYHDGFVLDGDPVSERRLVEAVEPLSSYLVTSYVEQHAYADDLYPHAANTIRLFTLWDDPAGELYTPIAVHRIGTERSRPIDNFAVGGVSAEIDLETGTLGPAAQFPFSGGSVPWYADHPDTGAPIEGTTIPRWAAVRETIERMALDNTNIPAIGWDVLLDESGEPIVLEANTGTTFDLIQVHRPLLADPRVAEIAARYLPEVDPSRRYGEREPSEPTRSDSPTPRRRRPATTRRRSR